MKNQYITYSAIGFVLLIAFGAGAFIALDKDEPTVIDRQETAKVENKQEELPPDTTISNNSALSSSLPSQTLATFEDAKDAVPFTLYQPTVTLGDESISYIEKIDSFVGDGKDSIAIKYGDDEGTLYRVNQSGFIGAASEDAKEVAITFMGKSIKAQFTQLAEPDENSEAAVYLSTSDLVPSSYLAWEYNKIAYEISEFGRVSQQELVKLAESMK